MRSREDAHRVATARRAFHEHGSVVDGAVDPSILTSWQRSRVAGIDVDRPEVPFHDATGSGSRLTRTADPVLRRLRESLGDMPICLALADPHGLILDRQVNDRSLARHHDRACFAPGFSYAEADVGTNGVGTAIEDGRAVFVAGAQHFTEQSTPFACAGAPVRNPVTRRVDGLIDISTLTRDAHPMMRALAEEAARDIERRLRDESSARERLVLEEFLAACRRRRGDAVLSASGDLVLANRRASSLLTPGDEALLQAMAADLGRRSDSVFEFSLATGQWARVHCRPVELNNAVAGAVFEVQLASSAGPTRRAPDRHRHGARVLPGLVGRSQAWLQACEQTRDAARERASLLLIGEQGVGKLALARAAHHEQNPSGQAAVVDFQRDAVSRVAELVARDAGTHGSIVLRRLDRLDAADQRTVAGLVGLLAAGPSRPWIAGTASNEAAVKESLLSCFATSLTVPPLRHRATDVEHLVPVLLRRLAPRREVAVGSDTMAVLARNAWPRNLHELSEVLQAALGTRPTGTIHREDLPPSYLLGSRRSLSPLEALERDAIVKALNDLDGNRKRAAERLGFSRSSLYRKIHAYAINV